MEHAVFLSLVSGMRQNAQEAFTEVVNHFGPRLHGKMAERFSGRAEELCEVVVQEAFIEMFRRLPDKDYFAFQSPGQFFSFLRRVAFRRGYDYLRRELPVVSLDVDVAATADRTEDTLAKLIRNETAARIEAALADESEQDRAMFLAHHRDGETCKHIADRIGCPVGTAQSRIHRCMMRVLQRVVDPQLKDDNSR
jgi:RNA polymerase sigma-70 factor (ECF subfamily)